MKRSIFFKLSLVSAVLLACVAVYFYFIEFLPLQKTTMRSNVMDRAAAIMAMSEKPVSRALLGHDDITLLNELQSIKSIRDVYAAYILGADGTVLSHDTPGEWGKRYQDRLSRNAIAAGQPLWQNTDDAEGWLFSAKITPGNTLCIGFSKQAMMASMRLVRKRCIYRSLIIFVIAAILLLGITRQYTVRRSERLISTLRTAAVLKGRETIVFDGNDEFAEIAVCVNAILSQCAGQNAPAGTRQSATAAVCAALSTLCGHDILVADADNRILYAGDDARKLFALSDGSPHLFDAVRHADMLSLIRESVVAPGTWREGNYAGRAVRVLTIANRPAGNAGTVIAVPRGA